MKKPAANSRNKGASFEREVAAVLHGLTGVTFKRDLEQYRAGEHGDLIADNTAFPFVIECKRYASGTTCKPAWRAQASAAANATGKLPAVVYRFDRQDTRVSVPFAAIAAAMGGDASPEEWAEVTIEGLAYLASEIMAEAK
jgi:Holliday junction resolvase